MTKNIETYDDDEENEDEKPIERPRPKIVPPPEPVPPVTLPAPPSPEAEEKPMSPIEEVMHRAGPRGGGKIFPFKRKIAGMGAVPSRLPEGATLTPDARIVPSNEMTRATTDSARSMPMPSEPEVIVVPVAPTPAPPNGIAGLVMGLLAIGGAVFLASMLSGTGEMNGTDEDDEDEGDDDEDLSGDDEGDSELERALAAPIEVAAPPKPKRKKRTPKLEAPEEDVIEGEILEDEDAA